MCDYVHIINFVLLLLLLLVLLTMLKISTTTTTTFAPLDLTEASVPRTPCCLSTVEAQSDYML